MSIGITVSHESHRTADKAGWSWSTLLTPLVGLACLVAALVIVTAPAGAQGNGPCVGGGASADQVVANPGGDWDGDGISNLGEVQSGADPCLHPCLLLRSVDVQINPNGDWDNDGWSNSYEAAQGMDPCQWTQLIPAQRGSASQTAPSSQGPAPSSPNGTGTGSVVSAPTVAPTSTPRPGVAPARPPTVTPTRPPVTTVAGPTTVIDFRQLAVDEGNRQVEIRTAPLRPSPTPTFTPEPTATPEPTSTMVVTPTVTTTATVAAAVGVDPGQGSAETESASGPENIGTVSIADASTGSCSGLSAGQSCITWLLAGVVLAGALALFAAGMVFDRRRHRSAAPSLTLDI